MIGKFRNAQNQIVEARIFEGRWQIVRSEKQSKDIFNRKGERKGGQINTVVVVLETLCNDEFKANLHPCSYDAVDLWESMPDGKAEAVEAVQEPELEPAKEEPKQDKPKTKKSSKKS